MAITPRSKGLGNIGSIVNRQRMAAPTRPAPKPAPKLAPTPMARPNTTTLAQRQAYQPFRSATKPAVSKFDPMSKQMPQPQVSPGPMMPPQPFNPNPTPQPSFEIRDMEYRPGRDYEVGGPGDPNMMTPTPMPGGGIFGGNLPGMVGNAVGQGIGGMFSNMHMFNNLGGMFGNTFGGNSGTVAPMDMFGGNQNAMFNNPTVDANGPAGQQPGNFGNPNPMSSDYDELEGSAFNTNPSMGSMFGNRGF